MRDSLDGRSCVASIHIPSSGETLSSASNGSQLVVSEEITNELNNQNTLSENPFVSAWQCLSGRGDNCRSRVTDRLRRKRIGRIQYSPRNHYLVLLISKDSNTNKISQKVRIQNLIGCHTSGKMTMVPGRVLYATSSFRFFPSAILQR